MSNVRTKEHTHYSKSPTTQKKMQRKFSLKSLSEHCSQLYENLDGEIIKSPPTTQLLPPHLKKQSTIQCTKPTSISSPSPSLTIIDDPRGPKVLRGTPIIRAVRIEQPINVQAATNIEPVDDNGYQCPPPTSDDSRSVFLALVDPNEIVPPPKNDTDVCMVTPEFSGNPDDVDQNDITDVCSETLAMIPDDIVHKVFGDVRKLEKISALEMRTRHIKTFCATQTARTHAFLTDLHRENLRAYVKFMRKYRALQVLKSKKDHRYLAEQSEMSRFLQEQTHVYFRRHFFSRVSETESEGNVRKEKFFRLVKACKDIKTLPAPFQKNQAIHLNNKIQALVYN